MTLSLADKQAVVTEVAEIAASAVSAVAADYRGLNVGELTQLRKQAREAGVYLRVVRNTLSRRAVVGTDFECMQEVLTGPLFLAFSITEPSAAARLLRDFAKAHKALEIKALSIGGKLIDAKNVDVVANLPTYEEAISKLMYVMKAPVEKFVRTLNEPHAKLVRTVAAIRDKKKAES